MTADIARLRALLEDIPLPLHWQASHLQGKAVDLKREHWLIGSAQTLQGLGLIFGNDSGLARLIVEAVNALPALLDEIERLRRCRYALEEALTPSAETKAAYIGEFSFPVEGYSDPVAVPWTTTKEIMADIKARALKSQTGDGT